MREKPVNAWFFLFWIGLFILLLFAFNRWYVFNRGGVESVHVSDQLKSIVIKAGRDHHFRFKGKIDHQTVIFLVDTGASKVAVPSEIAIKAGLVNRYPVRVRTANGITQASMTRIKTLTLGPIVLKNISAVIMPNAGSQVLLGMSALKKLQLKQNADLLTLTQTSSP